MADLLSRQPPRPYKLPESTQTSGQFPRQQYARPEVLTAGKKKQDQPRASDESIARAQNLATKIQRNRNERLRMLFPEAPQDATFESYQQNELQNALDRMPGEQRERYNWLVSQDQKLRGELTKIIGDHVGTTATRTTRTTTQRAPAQTQSQFSPGTQEIVGKYVDSRGRINVMTMAKDAVAEGYNSFKGDKAKREQWANAAKELGIAGEFSEAVEYATNLKIYGDRSGRLDVERMIADGATQEHIERLTGLGEQEFADIKTASGYKTDQGNIDVTRMVKELPQADVQRIMGISESEYKDLQIIAAHTDEQGNVDVATLISYGYSQDLLNRTLGLSQVDYDLINKQVRAQNILKPYTVNGDLDLMKAIEAGHIDQVQIAYDLPQADLAQAFDYLELKDKGYIDNQGNVDVMQILVDGKVDDRTLTNALQLQPADLSTYKTVAKYVDAEGNIDIMKAVQDNALPDIQKLVDVPQADLAKVFDYLELKDKGYVDPEGKVNVMAVIKDGKIDQRTLTSALDISKADYDEYSTLATYMDKDGNIDVLKALDQGVKPELLQKHLDFDMKEIEAIQQQQAAMGKLGQYLDVGIQDKAVSSKEARLLKNPKVDVLTAIKEGVEFETLNKALGMEKADYDNLKDLSAYTTKDGNIDVVKALYNGADPDKLQKQLDISDKEMKELVDYAKYEYWEPRYTALAAEDIDRMVGKDWNQHEKAAVVGAMIEAGLYDQGIKARLDKIGIHTTPDVNKAWNSLNDEEKEKVASLYMSWYDRVAATNMPLIEASFETVDKAAQAVKEGGVKIPEWVSRALIGVFPALGAGSYAAFVSEEKVEDFRKFRESVQEKIHQHFNEPIRAWASEGNAAQRGLRNYPAGAADILTGLVVDIPLTVLSIGEKRAQKDYNAAAAEAVALGGGMLLFPAQLAKKTLRDFPAGVGYTAGALTLFTATRGIVKLAKKGRAYADPYGIPDRMAAIEFSTGRVPVGKTASVKLVQDLVTKATKEIVSGKESGVVSKGGWQIKYRTTPIQRANASAVFHGTPDITPIAKLKPGETFVVDPASPLFTSAYATPRFVAATSMGKPAVKPGYMMVITDAGKIMTRETTAKGVTGPFKTYKGKIETEVVANPQSAFTRAKNLRTRILGPKAGEFFTQYMGPDVPGLRSGSLVPVVVMLDKGITKGPLSPATLYAAKLTMIREALIDYATALKHPKRTINDIISGRKGPPGVREMELARLTRELEAKAVENVLKKDLKGKKIEEALRVELERQFRINAERIYRELGAAKLEQYYSTPEGKRRYEDLYTSYMEPVLRDAVRTYETTDAMARTAVEYTESMPRPTLETPSLEIERELPTEERYIMTVKRRQSLREHPRVTGERRTIDERRDTSPERELYVTRSIESPPRRGTASERYDMRVVYDSTRMTDRRTPIRIEPPKLPPPPPPPPPPIEPPRIPPPKPPKRPPKRPPEEPGTGRNKKKRLDKPGTIHWRQGLWWISLVPRGRDNYVKLYSKAPPPDAPVHKRTPEETFFIKGGPDKVPKEVLVDMGIQSVKINPTGDPNLRFKRRRRR